MCAMNMRMLNWFRLIYLHAKTLITETQYMFTSMYLIQNAFSRISRLSRRNLVCWLHNPSYANSNDTGGAGESMQLLLDRGSTYLVVTTTLVRGIYPKGADFIIVMIPIKSMYVSSVSDN